MSKVLITQDLFNNINFDTPVNNSMAAIHTSVLDNDNKKPTVLIVFANSDVNAALYHLTKSLNFPSDPQAIATVIVQESIKQCFVEKLLQQLKTHSSNKIKSSEQFVKALERSKRLNAQIVTIETPDQNVYQPTLVCDFTHEQLGACFSPSGVVTLHAFRTTKEAIILLNKESLKFPNVSIWHENHSNAYELVAALKSKNFFINCYQVPLNILEESINQGKNYVNLDNSYHYETLQHDEIQKSIVFPIGTIFAN